MWTIEATVAQKSHNHSLWGQYPTSAFKELKPATLLTQFNVSTVCQEDVGALSETNVRKPQHVKNKNQLRTNQLQIFCPNSP